MASKQARPTLLLYRALLKHGKRYPSLSRDSIVAEIRSEFRRNRGLTDAAQLDKAQQRGMHGLRQMQQYVTLDPAATSWNVTHLD